MSENHRLNRLTMAKQLLKIYPLYDKRKFANVITGDETDAFLQGKEEISSRFCVTKNTSRKAIVKPFRTMKNFLYVMSFTKMDLPFKFLFLRVNIPFYKTFRLNNPKRSTRNCDPRLAGDTLDSFSTMCLLIRPFLPMFDLTWPPMIISLFPKPNMTSSGITLECRLAIPQCTQGVPLQDYENCLKPKQTAEIMFIK